MYNMKKFGIYLWGDSIKLHLPYIKFTLFFYTVWGDLNDKNYTEHRLLGIKLW